MSNPAARAAALWGLAVLLLLAIALRANFRTDLSAFLPRAPSAAQRLLVGQLQSGPAGRLIVAAIRGGGPTGRAAASIALARALRGGADFTSVENGDEESLARDREFLLRERYLLSPDVSPGRFQAAGLRAALEASLDTLAAPEGVLVKDLFARDPTGEFLGLLERASGTQPPREQAGAWSSHDGREALLLLQTRAPGADTDAQQRAIEAVQRAFAQVRTTTAQGAQLSLLLSGPPVFATEARALIRSEVKRLSALSAVLIALLLLSLYRSPLALLLTFVPVASGALAGVAAVALGFGTVHALTLGFGVTLIGESVDYSIYLFVQGEGAGMHLWDTLRLGVLTSIAGFAALLPSSFGGLAQLGLYSIAGLIAAALVTRYVLTAWRPRTLRLRDLRALGRVLLKWHSRRRGVPALLMVLALAEAALLWVQRGHLFSADLAALSPISLAAQDTDARVRADLGAPDVRYLVVVSAASAEAALEGAARLAAHLDPLVSAGTIGGYETPSRYLPPQQVQAARRASLPEPAALRTALHAALETLPVRAEALEPFVRDVAQARGAPLLTRADLEGTGFGALVEGLLHRDAHGAQALLPVSARGAADLTPEALAALHGVVAAAPGATLLDLKGETDRLYGGYLRQAVELSLAGAVAILALLLVALRSARRVARVLLPLALAVMGVAALQALRGEPLGILHIVGMLLIVAVASNYALFFDRARAHPVEADLERTVASVVVANLATVIGFGVLAFARVPVLAQLGATVAPGALLALLFAALLSGDLRSDDAHAD
ncbi:MAG: MMPL family transporter [Gammaproteobacteria bacterium]|nr:MMPL family transporter [Gammaproteobacteria bacterium]